MKITPGYYGTKVVTNGKPKQEAALFSLVAAGDTVTMESLETLPFTKRR